jgi:hypothetical protein
MFVEKQQKILVLCEILKKFSVEKNTYSTFSKTEL